MEAELAKPTVAKTGDVWLLGKHRVICGDSILPETYDKLMDGQKANLVLTDPPYNVNVEETAGKIKMTTCRMRISISSCLLHL